MQYPKNSGRKYDNDLDRRSEATDENNNTDERRRQKKRSSRRRNQEDQAFNTRETIENETAMKNGNPNKGAINEISEIDIDDSDVRLAPSSNKKNHSKILNALDKLNERDSGSRHGY